MPSTLSALFEHNLWANLGLLGACRPATPDQLAHEVPGSYGPPAATLLHMLSGEQSYVWRLNGEEREDRLQSDHPWPGVDALMEHGRWSGERLIALAVTLQPEDAVRMYDDETGRHMNASVVLVQAISHSAHHRSQVMTALSSQGIIFPEFDGWEWGEATAAVHTRS